MLKDVTWRLVYDKLWLKFRGEEIRFEDILEVIYGKRKFSVREIKYASKLLNEIEDNACAIHTRASYDQRVRIYRLLHPEKISNARAVFLKIHKKDRTYTLSDLVKEANKSVNWNYMYIKDSAAGFWTNYYRSIDVHHLSIKEEDLDGWLALFKLYGPQILVNDKIVYESTSKAQAIHLHTDLSSREDQVAEMTDLHYQLPHYTIAECLEDDDAQGALAVMVRCKDTLMWDKVIEAVKSARVINTLGFCMECINKEANKSIFNIKILKKIEKLIEKRTEIIGKTPELEVTIDYQDLEKKWNVKCYQTAVFKKIVEDLVR